MRTLDGPRLRVIGTVQDGGLPHAACSCAHCERARRDSRYRRYVASLALILPASGGTNAVYLIDASPDIPEQLVALRDVRDAPAGRVDRRPVDGVFLTHAHIGHYLGLAFFGFEAAGTKALPVYCTPRMAEFVRNNGPWSQLVRIDNIRLHEQAPGTSVELPFNDGREHVTVTSMPAPHRDEYSDTVGYIFRRSGEDPGRGRTVMYLPDTEPWSTWTTPLPEMLRREQVDTLLVDGTFYSADELPGRRAESIGHPLMTSTMDLLEPMVRAGELIVYFTHLNHSNPALEPHGAAARQVSARRFKIASQNLNVRL